MYTQLAMGVKNKHDHAISKLVYIERNKEPSEMAYVLILTKTFFQSYIFTRVNKQRPSLIPVSHTLLPLIEKDYGKE